MTRRYGVFFKGNEDYSHRVSRETSRAFAILTAFDTRQSPRFCMPSSVRRGMPVIAESLGRDMFFLVLSSFSFIYLKHGASLEALPLFVLVLFGVLFADFTCGLFKKFKNFFCFVAFQQLDNQLEKKCKLFVRHIQPLISKIILLYHVKMWYVKNFFEVFLCLILCTATAWT